MPKAEGAWLGGCCATVPLQLRVPAWEAVVPRVYHSKLGCVSTNSRLESNKEEEGAWLGGCCAAWLMSLGAAAPRAEGAWLGRCYDWLGAWLGGCCAWLGARFLIGWLRVEG